jgi:hypothetical protein
MAKAKIFISYAHRDQDAVSRIVAALKDVDLDVWVDTQSLTPGQNWIAEIEQALSDAGYLIAVLSHASLASEWMHREWTAMLSRQLDGTGGGIVIPLRFIRDERLADFLKWLAEESPRCVEVAIRKYMPEAFPPGL